MRRWQIAEHAEAVGEKALQVLALRIRQRRGVDEQLTNVAVGEEARRGLQAQRRVRPAAQPQALGPAEARGVGGDLPARAIEEEAARCVDLLRNVHDPPPLDGGEAAAGRRGPDGRIGADGVDGAINDAKVEEAVDARQHMVHLGSIDAHDQRERPRRQRRQVVVDAQVLPRDGRALRCGAEARHFEAAASIHPHAGRLVEELRRHVRVRGVVGDGRVQGAHGRRPREHVGGVGASQAAGVEQQCRACGRRGWRREQPPRASRRAGARCGGARGVRRQRQNEQRGSSHVVIWSMGSLLQQGDIAAPPRVEEQGEGLTKGALTLGA